MKVTLTQHDALYLATNRIRDLFPSLPVIVDIESLAPPAAEPYPKITAANKVELIKFVRQLAKDIFNNRIESFLDADGHPYFDLAGAKKYVEDYFKF